MTNLILKLFLGSLSALFRFLPERIGLGIGSFLGGAAFVFFFPRTRVAIRNLDRAMGRDLGKKQVRRTVLRMYRNFGKNLVDYFRLAALSRWKGVGPPPFQVEVEGIENAQAAFERGQGVLVLTAHLGNWELMAAWMGLLGFPVNILTKRIRQPVLNEWMLETRRSLGIQSIYKKESIREIIARLKRNEAVAFVLDQRVSRREGVKVRFFGRPAWAISGLATLSMRYGVPVLPVVTFRETGGGHRIVIEPSLFFESTGNREEDIRKHTQRYTDILERHIRAHPDQWIWIHNRWEDEEDSQENRSPEGNVAAKVVPGETGSGVAVFLDRDGTLNEEVGYLSSLNRFRLLPNVGQAVARTNRAGLKAVLMTNQSGIGRGYFSQEFVEETHRHLEILLAREGARLDAIYLCPHHPGDHCKCRKPEPGLMIRAAQEHGIDLSRSFVVGDKLVDIETAHRVGAKGILVLTGYGSEELMQISQDPSTNPSRRPDHVAKNLSEAVQWVLEQTGREAAP